MCIRDRAHTSGVLQPCQFLRPLERLLTKSQIDRHRVFHQQPVHPHTPVVDALIQCVQRPLVFGQRVVACYLLFHTDLLTAIINLLQSNLSEQQGLTYLLYAAFSGTPLTEISVSASGALSYVMEILTQSLETSLPTLCISMVLLGGLIGFLLLRFVLKKTGGSVLAVPPFRQMSMPKNFTWYAILAYILVLLVELIFNIDLAVVRDILLGCFVLILTVQGLAFLDFFLSIRMKTRALEILIEVACVLFLSTMLVFLGIFDQVFRLRQAPPDNN